MSSEIYVSVDVETSGPNPGPYSLLSIGACLIDDPGRRFYVELQPVTMEAEAEAMAVHRLSLERLAREGLPPAEAMGAFEAWLQQVVPPGSLPVFVGFNAAFDWMFVADYFHRYLGRNPFGHAALDIKAFYAGLTGASWRESDWAHAAARYGRRPSLPHNALEDACEQAALFRRLLDEASKRGCP